MPELRKLREQIDYTFMRVYQIIGLGTLLGLFACQAASNKLVPRTFKEEILAERPSAGTYHFAMEQLGTWELYAGDTPETIDWDQRLYRVQGADTSVNAPFQPRSFWGLISPKGDTSIVSEREIVLNKALNFRDLGGIKTQEGKRVKWGLFFRSGKLDGLNAADQNFLKQLGISHVVDFRSDGEVEEAPDQLPPEISYQRVIIGLGQTMDRKKLMDSLKTLNPAQSANLLVEANKLFAGASSGDYQPFVELIDSGSGLPIVFHCTAGKDRTGFGAALILLALGVDRETIMNDFLMSNYYRVGHGNFRMNFTWVVGLKREVIEPLMEVRPEYLQAAFATIDSLYGGTDAFLEEVYGLNDSVRQEWVERFTY
ncbi:MAG: tyrosine-protein phosphatase [Bacteroidota bacterium]